ncbi:carbamoyltransferase HypF [Streptomyces sp. ACA25]|nr:carbamoyltransferase HypF [Streptomyces sp. ACA25]MDB1088540.1 carbamoyltransferase HypF [Streptomyces sp. ACA25]
MRRRVTVRGIVQGVGFRPFVHALAVELGLSGHVTNSARGVLAEVEGEPTRVADFCARLTAHAPPLATVTAVAHQDVPVRGGTGFAIRPSEGGAGRTLVPPDTAVCADCLAELADPADRRHRHPFITCTHCGPRFTLTTAMPYDRATTTMAGFPLCAACEREYRDPADRRFHAQPVSCRSCGPRLVLDVPADGPEPDGPPAGDAAVARARALLADGAVLAVKGIGGYHLACDAGSPEAVQRLRERKGRGAKPFAVMAADLRTAEQLAQAGPAERAALTGRRRPIVLLPRHPRAPGTGSPLLAGAVCPGSPDVGVMLPYTPLHHLLFGLPGDPPGPRVLVMTSGNRSGEPLAIGDAEARERLAGLADAWLRHDREIAVPCDDSVIRVRADGSEVPLRRSRGWAPVPLDLPVPVPPSLAVGGDLKNTFCLGEGRSAWLSAHIGDLDGLATQRAFTGALGHLRALTGVRPVLVAADRHPGYRSTRWARERPDGPAPHLVQHHHAHIAAVMADNGLDGSAPVIGIAFDGTGYGDDGAVWGGEVLLADYRGYRRLAHLGYVPLPGGDAAVRNPYRMALSHLRAAGLPWDPDLPCVAACPAGERRVLERQLERGIACVPTSSMGRLFDAVSSLLGIRHRVDHEAQAAVALEAAAREAGHATGQDPATEAPGGRGRARPPCAFALLHPPPAGDGDAAPHRLDPAPVLRAVITDLRAGTPVPVIAARFHHAVAGAVTRVCRTARRDHGIRTVALSGGVFGNALLEESCTRQLTADGFTVLRHHHVPPGDGGLALGQLVVAAVQTAPSGQETENSHVPGSARQSDRHQ